MKSALLVVLLAAAATAAVLSHEEPGLVEVPDVDNMAEQDVKEIREVFVTDVVRLTEVEEPPPTAVETRQELSLGNITSADRLIMLREYKEVGTPDIFKIRFVIVETYEPISAIRLTRVGASQNATTSIKGGIGSWRITIKIRSALGGGYHYKMQIYARNGVLHL